MTDLGIQNISKRFGGVEVLRDISLAFEKGSVTALVGDNGAGKSTLLKILAGSHNSDCGHIVLHNVELTNCSAESRRRAGIEMVYQDLALAKRQDVVTNLFLGREKTFAGGLLRRKAMRKECEATLEKLGIKLPSLERPVGLLSGGQQQAIAIARAVMFDPKVLLLDEPTAALAAKEVENTLDLIKEQKMAGRILVLVSHRLNDVLAVADRIVVLKHGRIFSDVPSSSVTLADIVELIVS